MSSNTIIGIVLFMGLNSMGYSQVNFNLSDATLNVGQRYELQNIRFSLHGNELIDESKAEIDRVVIFLKQHRNLVIEIGSHTDSRGKNNILLSQNRADRVREYIIQQGIDSTNIMAKGYGELEPIIEEEKINRYRRTDKEKFQLLHTLNRRMEMKIVNIITP